MTQARGMSPPKLAQGRQSLTEECWWDKIQPLGALESPSTAVPSSHTLPTLRRHPGGSFQLQQIFGTGRCVCQTAGLGREGPGSPWAVPVPVTEGAEGARDGFSGALDCWGDQRQACLFRILIAVVSCWRSRCLGHPSHPIPAVPSLPRRATSVAPGVTAPSTTELTEKGE